jgi:DNA (cytosine-5)-methyltransferase 1
VTQFTIGSLFAGIGGFDLGFERAGFKTAWQVEIDPYCQKVLAKNFPEAERFGDIRECGSHNLKPVDVICGGFPCQDISNAGKRAGIEGERSGLWTEMHRIIRELRPRYVLVENVAALLGRGMGVVLGDLAEIGYDAEWRIISAADMGASHLRERVWILAYPIRFGHIRPVALSFSSANQEWNNSPHQQGGMAVAREVVAGSEAMAHAQSERPIEAGRVQFLESEERSSRCGEDVAYTEGRDGSRGVHGGSESEESSTANRYTHRWPAGWGDYQHEYERPRLKPRLGGTDDGIRAHVDRLRGLGNAVVPQIPEMIARRIKQALEAQS